MSYVVKLIRPDKKDTPTLFSCVIDKSENVKMIYDAVSFFEKNIFLISKMMNIKLNMLIRYC